MKWFDFAWLKQWWPEVTRRKPHVGRARNLTHYVLLDGVIPMGETVAPTKSEARAMFKQKRGIKGRLPLRFEVVERIERTRGMLRRG